MIMKRLIFKAYKVLLTVFTVLYSIIIFLGADSIMENEGPLMFLAMAAIMFGAWWLVALSFKD